MPGFAPLLAIHWIGVTVGYRDFLPTHDLVGCRRRRTKSTKHSIWLGTDDSARDCHLYWELAERTEKAAPIFMSIRTEEKGTALRLPKEVGEKIRDILAPDARISSRAGVAPAEVQRLSRRTVSPTRAYRMPLDALDKYWTIIIKMIRVSFRGDKFVPVERGPT